MDLDKNMVQIAKELISAAAAENSHRLFPHLNAGATIDVIAKPPRVVTAYTGKSIASTTS